MSMLRDDGMVYVLGVMLLVYVVNSQNSTNNNNNDNNVIPNQIYSNSNNATEEVNKTDIVGSSEVKTDTPFNDHSLTYPSYTNSLSTAPYPSTVHCNTESDINYSTFPITTPIPDTNFDSRETINNQTKPQTPDQHNNTSTTQNHFIIRSNSTNISNLTSIFKNNSIDDEVPIIINGDSFSSTEQTPNSINFTSFHENQNKPFTTQEIFLTMRVVPRNLTVRCGERASMTCRVENRGPKTVIWGREQESHPISIGELIFDTDTRISIDHIHLRNEWILHIDDVKPSDEGMYLCKISAIDISESLYLNVESNTFIETTISPNLTVTENPTSNQNSSTPSISLPIRSTSIHPTTNSSLPVKAVLRNVSVMVGDVAVMSCTVERVTDYVLIWKRENQTHPISLGNVFFTPDSRMILAHNVLKNQWTLKIMNVQLKDDGMYLCQLVSPNIGDYVNLNVYSINSARAIAPQERSIMPDEFDYFFLQNLQNDIYTSHSTPSYTSHSTIHLTTHSVIHSTTHSAIHSTTHSTTNSTSPTKSIFLHQVTNHSNTNNHVQSAIVPNNISSALGTPTKPTENPKPSIHPDYIPDPLVVTTLLKVVTVRVGEDAKLICKTQNLGNRMIVWRNSISPITFGTYSFSENSRVSVEVEHQNGSGVSYGSSDESDGNGGDVNHDGGDISIWTVTISDVRKRDEDRYRCMTNLRGGRFEDWVDLHVLDLTMPTTETLQQVTLNKATPTTTASSSLFSSSSITYNQLSISEYDLFSDKNSNNDNKNDNNNMKIINNNNETTNNSNHDNNNNSNNNRNEYIRSNPKYIVRARRQNKINNYQPNQQNNQQPYKHGEPIRRKVSPKTEEWQNYNGNYPKKNQYPHRQLHQTYQPTHSSTPSSLYKEHSPTLRAVLRNVTVGPGQVAKLKCKVDNLGTKTLTWRKEDELHPISIGSVFFAPDSRMSLDHSGRNSEWTLIITDVKPSDEGKYLCQISSKHDDISDYITLNVKTIRLTGTDYVERGNTIELMCNVTGKPDPPEGIDWFKGDVRIDSQRDEKVVITKKIETRILTSMLTIRNSQPSDSAEYTCQSTDKEASSIKVLVVNVSSPSAIKPGYPLSPTLGFFFRNGATTSHHHLSSITTLFIVVNAAIFRI